ncbi:hypothetical protein D1872_131600 [compost metagenome]
MSKIPVLENQIVLIDAIDQQISLYENDFGIKPDLIRMSPLAKRNLNNEMGDKFRERIHSEIYVQSLSEEFMNELTEHFFEEKGMRMEIDPSLDGEVLFQLSKN